MGFGALLEDAASLGAAADAQSISRIVCLTGLGAQNPPQHNRTNAAQVRGHSMTGLLGEEATGIGGTGSIAKNSSEKQWELKSVLEYWGMGL